MIRYLDLFAGVGGFRAGFDLAGGYQCVGHCEIDKYADASYHAIHTIRESEVFYPDARTIDPDDVPPFDLLCGGFPCQSFSVAGQRKGFADTRGTLFFEVARILRCKKPRYVLLENVPGLLSHDQGKTFAVILQSLCELGYCVEWTVLNSKDFGVPQSRKRVFIVGYLDPRCAGKILPDPAANGTPLIQVLGGPQGSRVYDPKGLACTQTAQAGGSGGKTGLYAVGFNRKDGITHELKTAYALNASNFRGLNRNQNQNAALEIDNRQGTIDNDGSSAEHGMQFVDLCYGHPEITDSARCLTANYNKSRMSAHKGEMSGVLLIKGNVKRGYHPAHPGDSIMLAYPTTNKRHTRVLSGLAHTLDTGSKEGVVTLSGRIRRLTPRECFRLQGFSEDQIDRVLAVTSDAQAYKQAGNCVTVNVIRAIGERLAAVDNELNGGEPP